jgi:RNA polymerase sigma factor (sigma-70 family)
MQPDDLVAGLAAGHEESWQQFLSEYGRLIFAVTARTRLSPDDQEDVFQNTCLAIQRSIGTLRDPSRLSAWVYGIAYRLSIDVIRKQRRESPAQDPAQLSGVASTNPPPDAGIESLEEAARLYDFVDRLGPRCRRLVRKLYLDQPTLSYTEIAASENMPIGSVGPTRARCLEKLRHLLSKGYDR